MSAAFIIMTGLTTGIAEQQRGLAIIRCIGGTKAQLAQAQLLRQAPGRGGGGGPTPTA